MTDARQEDRGVPEVGGTPLAGRSAVVTGASSGIGRATARALAAAGASVGLAARRAGRLEELVEEIGQSGGEVLAIPTDVAGVMLPAPIAEADPADWRRMVDVNLVGVLYATRAVLPGMLERGDGHVVNVSSTSGRTHQPLFSVYAATKHGLGAFTNILRKEVHPSRVRVTLFEPGPTESELGSHVDPEVMRTSGTP